MVLTRDDVGDQLLATASSVRRRRRARYLLLIAPVVGFAGLELGGLTAVNRAEADAQRLRAAHDYPGAVAAYRAVATRTGPVYYLARSQTDSAVADAERVLLEWATSLAAAGRIDEALVACDRVTLPGLLDAARRERAQIAFDAARAEAGKHRFDVALHRLDELLAGRAPADLTDRAAALRPVYGLDAGRALLGSGQAGAAVRAFDEVIGQASSSPQAATARTLLPSALLAAGQQALESHDQATALAHLQRLVSSFGATPEARAAQTLLAAPQNVTGTLVRRDGSPVAAAQVRLGSHYHRAGASYVTSTPFYYATTDRRGDFDFAGVPIGGPFTLEVLQADGWTTIVTADNQPAYQVTITPLSPVDLAFVVVPS